MMHLLPAVPQSQWRESSQARCKDQFGNQNCTRFRVSARLDDGAIRWRGWFDSRDEADVFLEALVRFVTLGEVVPNPIRQLPTPWWDPDIGPWVTYDFATVTFLTSPTQTLLSFPSPSDWN